MNPPVIPAPSPTAAAGPRADSRRSRDGAAATSLIASPLLLTAAFVVVPTVAADRVALGVIAGHPGRWFLFGLLLLFSYLLLVPATLGLVHLAHQHRPAWADVGGALAVLGAVTAVADTRLVFVMGPISTPGADRGEMVALLDRLGTDIGSSLPFIIGTLALVTGTVMLAMALPRSGVPVWGSAALGIGIVAHVAAFILASQPALIATSALLVVGYGMAATRLLRGTSAVPSTS